MMTVFKKLNEVKPREQSGSLTATQYEYQQCQTANACVGLLEFNEQLCIFCEWHDDFVTEYTTGSVSIYGFCQVKTKSLSEGPWTIASVFGTRRTKGALNDKSPFYRMFVNYIEFFQTCRSFTFLTNTGINDELRDFMQAINNAGSQYELGNEDKEQFKKIWEVYRPHFRGRTDSDFYVFLKLFKIKPESSHLGDHVNVLKGQIRDRIEKFCEIPVNGKQTGRITQNLLDLVRSKASKVINEIPISEGMLKESKSVSIKDIAELLPLSKDGLRALQSGSSNTRENLLSLSRLQRLCQENNIPAGMIEEICKFKVRWDVWYLGKKYNFIDADYDFLRMECRQVLLEVAGLSEIGQRAQQIVDLFNPKVTSDLQVNQTLIMGFIFSIAAEMGPIDE